MDYIIEVLTALIKHGWSLTTIGIAVTALLRVNGVRKIILRRLPKRFRYEPDDRLERIERKLDVLLDAGVPEWKITGALKTQTPGPTNLNPLSSLLPVAIYPVKRLRRAITMKSSINWVTLIVALLGAAKIALQAFGIDIIDDEMIDKASNAVAAIVTLVGVIMSHRKKGADTVAAAPIVQPTASVIGNDFH